MKFRPTPLEGAYIIEMEPRGDERGFFARMFCQREMAEAGLEARFVQLNNSYSARRGTLRGLHYQLPPAAEVKLIRCVRGVIWDVIVDLRPQSASFRQWFACELSETNRQMMYVPRGFAHGFMALSDQVETIYLVSDFYAPRHERGLRFNDPCLGIVWPLDPSEISDKDRSWPDLETQFHGLARLREIG